MKRIYISGCGGMLGEAFYEQFRHAYDLKCTDIDVNDEWLSYCDIRHYHEYYSDVYTFRPDYLFHLGALTDLEYCELHPDEAYQTNTISVENAVHIANSEKIPIVYISTAGIFDGQKDYYDDWDIPNPLGVYARSKYMGERFVVDHAHKYIVARAGWMMGGGPRKDKKYIQKIMGQLKDGRKELNVVIDKDGTPTYTHDFARQVKLLIEREQWGLYNILNHNLTSRYEVTLKLLELLGLEKEIKINIVSSNFFKKEYFATRPPNERLINYKLHLRGLDIMRPWQEALEEYLRRDYGNL